MPVVCISGLSQPSSVDVTSALTRLCLRLAELDGVEARHWWATWLPIARDNYVEGDVRGAIRR